MKKIYLIASLFILLSAFFLAWFIPSAFIGSPAPTNVEFRLGTGVGVSDLAQALEARGIISSALGYKIYAVIDPASRKAKAGDYEIAPGSSFRSIMRQFALGPASNEREIKIIEGSTISDLSAQLAKYGVSATSMTSLVGDSVKGKPFAADLRKQFSFLSALPPKVSLEGYLFPDTYRVWKDQLPLSLVLKQLNAFDKNTQGFVDESAKQGRSLEEVVILASIVEKEARTPEERRVIAGIFLNRLKNHMRLQSDATVNYVTNAGRARPSITDTQVDSPYNTYQNDGLPPGPICNPGKDSLDAALNPTKSDYFYYLHDDSGKVYYARTLEEHKANRYKAYGE